MPCDAHRPCFANETTRLRPGRFRGRARPRSHMCELTRAVAKAVTNPDRGLSGEPLRRSVLGLPGTINFTPSSQRRARCTLRMATRLGNESDWCRGGEEGSLASRPPGWLRLSHRPGGMMVLITRTYLPCTRAMEGNTTNVALPHLLPLPCFSFFSSYLLLSVPPPPPDSLHTTKTTTTDYKRKGREE